MNGARVNAVVDELYGEKIDIVEWNEDPAIFIEHALSPSKVVSVTVDPSEKSAEVLFRTISCLLPLVKRVRMQDWLPD